jgi:hypothetical protein
LKELKMNSKKGASQKNATQPEVKSIPSQKKSIDERYNPPNPMPTLKDRPKPKSTPSQSSKQETTPSSAPSKKD